MNTLSQLVCSRVRAEIFRILFGPRREAVHLRELQRQTGFAVGTVRQDIEKLVKLDLVSRHKDGIRELDHLIVSRRGYFSFQENGLIR